MTSFPLERAKAALLDDLQRLLEAPDNGQQLKWPWTHSKRFVEVQRFCHAIAISRLSCMYERRSRKFAYERVHSFGCGNDQRTYEGRLVPAGIELWSEGSRDEDDVYLSAFIEWVPSALDRLFSGWRRISGRWEIDRALTVDRTHVTESCYSKWVLGIIEAGGSVFVKHADVVFEENIVGVVDSEFGGGALRVHREAMVCQFGYKRRRGYTTAIAVTKEREAALLEAYPSLEQPRRPKRKAL